jgi:AAA domain
MCTSGARLQLAIAPAGAGKTTAMHALTLAWTQDGGQLVGLAPSAAAAAVLGEQTGIRADTLAKLTWSLGHGDLPDWAAAVGPSTLVIIDEAGMADTLSLDAAVQFAINRGASVRLIGDDQQLAAIGAGGVLRDITHNHGALQLTELHRFTDPAEAEASLALREGDPSALGFYLYQGRVNVGDLAKITEDAFAACISDGAVGNDAIVLDPTRELVAELNRRARDHRRDGAPAGQEVRLGDGNRASVGDTITTRANDRRLRLVAIRPDAISPRTPTETLQRIIARDETPISASSLLRQLTDPVAGLLDAVQRYIDGLHAAAEQLVGAQTVAELDQADQYVPGLTGEPAWPTLRAHLIDLAAETGQHPLRHLQTAAAGRDLSAAGDMAAVLYWRLIALPTPEAGPLPWLPHVPHAIQDHPAWGDYLAKRAQHVADLASQIRDLATRADDQPVWAPPRSHPSTALMAT